MKETNISQLVRIEASNLGAVLWRNNTGKFQDKNGRWVSFGLCTGSADLIGIYKGKFVALEVKQPGKKPRQDQIDFINTVKKLGGIASVITDPSQLKYILEEGYESLHKGINHEQ